MPGMRSHRCSFLLWMTGLFGASILLGCEDRAPIPETEGMRDSDAAVEAETSSVPTPVMECERLAYPCTSDEVDEAAAARTVELLVLAREAAVTGNGLADIVDFLETRPDVEWVMADEEAVRFQPAGGRPTWIISAEAFWPGTRSVPGELPQGADQADAVAGKNEDDFTKKPLKKALILAPFQWEFGSDELTKVKEELTGVKDYSCPGCVVTRVGQGGTESINYNAFMDWEEYQLIHVSSHGTQLCDPAASGPTCVTAILTGWQMLMSPEALGEYWHQQSLLPTWRPRGVELAWFMPSSSCERPPIMVDPSTGQAGNIENPIRAGTDAYARLCGDFLARDPILKEVVTDDFFRSRYKGGLPDKIIFLSACQSMKDPRLANHLASGGNTAVLGWTETVDNSDAIKVAEEFYSYLLDILPAAQAANGSGSSGGAFRVKDAYDRAKKEMGEGIFGITGSGIVRGPGGTIRHAGTGGDLIKGGSQVKRARELVALHNPGTGFEVADGTRMEIVGSPGDGKPDRLDVVIEVVGVGEDQNPAAFPLHLRLNEADAVGTYALNEPVRDGTYRYRGLVDLGFDVARNGVYDINVWTDLPGGGISRWLYEDVILGRPCSWEAWIEGKHVVAEEGDKATFARMPGGMIVIGLEQTRENGALGFHILEGGPRTGETGSFGAMISGGSLGVPVGHALAPHESGQMASVFLTENSEDVISGTGEGPVTVVSSGPDGVNTRTAQVKAKFDISRDPSLSGLGSVVANQVGIVVDDMGCWVGQ